jgi:hypothetical protein
MDILQDMRVFVRVVKAGSFTAAANGMDATTGQASRAVSDLEAHLRTRLLSRTTRRIALTEAGERYYDHCMQILALIEQAEAEAADAHARPFGKLRIRTPVAFGQHYLIKAIGPYQKLYPQVKIRLTLANGTPEFPVNAGRKLYCAMQHRRRALGVNAATGPKSSDGGCGRQLLGCGRRAIQSSQPRLSFIIHARASASSVKPVICCS